jgi:hypothetical protein
VRVQACRCAHIIPCAQEEQSINSLSQCARCEASWHQMCSTLPAVCVQHWELQLYYSEPPLALCCSVCRQCLGPKKRAVWGRVRLGRCPGQQNKCGMVVLSFCTLDCVMLRRLLVPWGGRKGTQGMLGGPCGRGKAGRRRLLLQASCRIAVFALYMTCLFDFAKLKTSVTFDPTRIPASWQDMAGLLGRFFLSHVF